MRIALVCAFLFGCASTVFSQAGAEPLKPEVAKVTLLKRDLNDLDPNTEVTLTDDSRAVDRTVTVDAGKGPLGPCAVVHFTPSAIDESEKIARYRIELPNASNIAGGDADLKPQFMVYALSSMKGLRMCVEVVDSEDHHLLTKDQEVPMAWTRLGFSLTDFYGWYGDGADGAIRWPIKVMIIRFEVPKENAKGNDFETFSIQSFLLEQMKSSAPETK